jgi:hypothetical protein
MRTNHFTIIRSLFPVIKQELSEALFLNISGFLLDLPMSALKLLSLESLGVWPRLIDPDQYHSLQPFCSPEPIYRSPFQ